MLKYRFPFIILIMLVLFLTACGTNAAESTATPLPPTETPLPTNTATVVPTATANLTATAIAQVEEAEAEVLAELDKLLDDTEVPYKDGRLAWKQDEELEIRMLGPDGELLSFADGVNGDNFILKSDVTWSSTGILICGVIFRSEPNLEEGKQYNFVFLRFSGAPAWAIEYHEFGRF